MIPSSGFIPDDIKEPGQPAQRNAIMLNRITLCSHVDWKTVMALVATPIIKRIWIESTEEKSEIIGMTVIIVLTVTETEAALEETK